MTRFTRVKSTHQRIEGESTPWNDLKDTPAKDDKKNHRDSSKNKTTPRKPMENGGKKFEGGQSGNQHRYNKNKRPDKRKERNDDRGGESANFTPLGGSNPNVKGRGETKSIKIFGNFWVGEDDAKRLQGMAKKLQKEGVSRKDILKALQEERRKAEKALKRRRDKTCFNCRQFGHVLADCPKGEAQEGAEGGGEALKKADGDICFKCGSTEHTSRTCKRKSDKFQFAKCFHCSKTGHLARQCPTNSKGIYPSGGNCDECGSVHHLKRDCPDVIGNEELGKDDVDAQIGRVSNPFVSTEYEEVPEEAPPASAEDKEENEEEIKEPKPKKSKAFKRKNADPIEKNESDNTSFNSKESSDKDKPPITIVQQKPSAPKKRRVKF